MRGLRWRTEKQTLTWFSQAGWTRRWAIWALGMCSAAAQLRYEAPLATTQNIRFAEAYGSVCMT